MNGINTNAYNFIKERFVQQAQCIKIIAEIAVNSRGVARSSFLVT